MAQLNFDAAQVTPDTGVLDAIPAGWYNCMMDQSEMKPTKDGAGAYLECRFEVMDGAFKGRKLYARLNLRNASPQAQEIAYKQLSAIAHAVQVLQVQDSSQLHGRPLKIKVAVKAADGQYEAANEIKAYKDINFVTGGPVAGPATPVGAVPPVQQFASPAAPAQNFTVPAQPAGGWVAQPPAPQMPVQAPAAQWQQPAAQQPWGQPQGPALAQPPVQAQPPMQQAAPPMQQPAPAPAPAPTWAPPAGVAPAAGPQTAVPAWAQGPQG